ncbi:MAG: NADH-quinone oxidoreductase subunit 5 family protein [Actinomycetes bacterium]
MPALPALAALVGLLLGRRLPGGPAVPAVAGTAAATLCSLLVAAEVLGDDPTRARTATTTFTPTGLFDIVLGTRVDGLAAVVALMVCGVALCVQVYSVTYMEGDHRYSSYAAFVSLFTAAMLLVVLSADLLVLYVGWEVMGICSYFLVGHHWELAEARSAAVKAFVVTRIGDVAFLFGIFALGVEVGSFQVADVLAAESVPTIATMLLLGGVVGKSAQFPLHVWLPDAMAGPTPISALIHAATMVAAGVYVVALLYPVFETTPDTLAVLGVIAAISMLGAALAALAQEDLKRVLAYSTVSQLAYMAGALAVGGYAAGVFHLLTHGAFKALLFLGAGVVIHVVGSNLLSDMGGLRHTQPLAFGAMTVGLASLAGIPPFSGFFSKEAVLVAAEHAAEGGVLVPSWVGWVVFCSAVVTVAVTAAYATRVWLRTFFGRAVHASHEGPGSLMGGPLFVLAFASTVLGVIGLVPSWLPAWLGTGQALLPTTETSFVSLSAVGIGVLAVYGLWRRDPLADPATGLRRLRPVLLGAFWVDEAYDVTVVRPTGWLARGVLRTDDDVVDATVVGAGGAARLFGGALRLSQNGNVQTYLTGLLAGVVAILVGVALLS